MEFALNEKATNGKLFALESIKIESGKTKDAAAMIKTAGVRDALIILNSLEASTLLAFRNSRKISARINYKRGLRWQI